MPFQLAARGGGVLKCCKVTLLKVTPVMALMFMVVWTSSKPMNGAAASGQNCSHVKKLHAKTAARPHWIVLTDIDLNELQLRWQVVGRTSWNLIALPTSGEVALAGEICTMTLLEGGNGCNMQASLLPHPASPSFKTTKKCFAEETCLSIEEMLCKDDLPWKSALSDSLGITWWKLNCFVSIAFGLNPVGGRLAHLWFYFVASLVLVSGCVEPGLLGL